MIQRAVSTELTGGAGFTYEDTVVAYYLAKILREDRAVGQSGIVKTVAVQQAGHGDPMDDVIVEFNDAGFRRKLSLQGKIPVTISAANTQFRDVVARAVAKRTQTNFNSELDSYGFFGEHIPSSEDSGAYPVMEKGTVKDTSSGDTHT